MQALIDGTILGDAIGKFRIGKVLAQLPVSTIGTRLAIPIDFIGADVNEHSRRGNGGGCFQQVQSSGRIDIKII